MTIRAVIFDLGGVLVRTPDFSPREQLAARFGMTLDELMNFVFDRDSGTRAQRGEISVAQHWANIGQRLNLSTQEMDEFQRIFWGTDFLDTELVEYLRGLRGRYRTGLLSNAFSDLRQVVTERMKFADAFDEMIISSEVGLMKPDPAIYNLAAERLNVSTQEAIFVDDMTANVEGARAVGMHGIQYRSTPQVLAELGRLLNGS